MRKGFIKKGIVLLTSLAATIALLPGKDAKAAQMINPNPLIDVIINSCMDYNVPYATFEADLSDKIKDLLDAKEQEAEAAGQTYDGPTINDVRISQAGVKIDTTNLDDWYVYDHYESGSWYGNDATATSEFAKLYAGRRPFVPYTTNYGTRNRVYELSEFINGENGLNVSNLASVYKVKNHIYSTVDAYGKASMLFTGYGDRAYNDFLFYPAITKYKKYISFDLDASFVNTHSMKASGFLFNTGVDTNGKLQGYLMSMEYSSNTSAEANIYRLNGTQTPAQISGASDGLNSIAKTTVAGPVAISLPSATKKMKIAMEISPDFVSLTGQPYESANTLGTVTTLFNNVGINTASFPYTEYNGFGPMVNYTGHACQYTSYFVYSDLVMSYDTDAFESVRNSQFAKDRSDATVKRYYINLGKNNPDIPDDSVKFDEGINRLINDKVVYMSTVQEEMIFDRGTDHIGDYIGDDNTYYSTSDKYDKYVEEFAKYIVENAGFDTAKVHAPALQAPSAKFTIIGKAKDEPDTSYKQLLSIHKKHLQDQNNSVLVTFSDESQPIDPSSRPIKTWEYIIRDANSMIVSQKTVTAGVSADMSAPTYEITTQSPEGTYSLSLRVKDENGIWSDNSTLTFTVINDTQAPNISVSSSSTDPEKIVLNLSDDKSGVQEYRIDDGATQGAVQRLATVRLDTKVTVPVPQNTNDMIIHVWDECGNENVVTLKKYAITYYTNLSDTTTVYDTVYAIKDNTIGAFPAEPTDTSGEKGFVGWFKEAAGENAALTTDVVTGDISLYGQWNSESCTVELYDSATNKWKSIQTKKGTLYSSVVAKLTDLPTKAGYDFTGWFKDDTCTTPIGNSAASDDVNKIYAGWTKGEVPLILDYKGGTAGKVSDPVGVNGTAVQTVISNYGSKINPTKNGYNFTKWQASDDNGNTLRDVNASDVLGDNGFTIYALWERDAMQFVTKTLSTGKALVPYNDKISATNGTKKYEYTITSGKLPKGLTLNKTTGDITGTPEEKGTFSFTVKAQEMSNGIIPPEECTSQTANFSITVAAGDKPTVNDKTIKVKTGADETLVKNEIKNSYEDILGVKSATVGTLANGKYPVVITYEDYCGGGTKTVYVTPNYINPVLEAKYPVIPDKSSIDAENANSTALLAYVNKEEYRELIFKSENNTEYIAAIGDLPTKWELPAVTFANEKDGKPYNEKGDTYNFTQNYLGNNITRSLTVSTNMLDVKADDIFLLIDAQDFVPDATALHQLSVVSDATFTYSIPTENLSDGVVEIKDGKIHVLKAGTTRIYIKAQKEHYMDGLGMVDVIVSEYPDVKVKLGADETFVKNELKKLFENTEVFESASVGDLTNGKYPITVTYDDTWQGENRTIYITPEYVKPILEAAYPVIPGINSTDTENANSDALLSYVNEEEFRELLFNPDINGAYIAAIGELPTKWELPETSFSDEKDGKTYDPKGQTYTFDQTYMGNDISRSLTVSPTGISVEAQNILIFSDSDDFIPDAVAKSNETLLDGVDFTYSIPEESSLDGVLEVKDGKLHILKAGTTNVCITGSKQYYTDGQKVITIIVSDKPIVKTEGVVTNVAGLKATLAGLVRFTSETTGVASGIEYRKVGDDDFTILNNDSSDEKFSLLATELEKETEYEYRAFAVTPTGIVYGDLYKFILQDEILVVTGEAEDITAFTAKLTGEIIADLPDEIGFVYKRADEEVFIKRAVDNLGLMEFDLTGLNPSTEYVFAPYVIKDGKTTIGEYKTFETLAYNPVGDVNVTQKDGDEDPYLLPKNDDGEYVAIIKDDDTQIKANYPDDLVFDYFTVEDIELTNPDLVGDEDNTIGFDPVTGEIKVGKNVKSGKITIIFEDGTQIVLNVLRGNLAVDIVNKSENVVANADQEYLQSSIDINEVESIIKDGDDVDVNLVVSDMTEEEKAAAGFEEFVKESINEFAHSVDFSLDAFLIVNKDYENAEKIHEFINPVYVQLEFAAGLLDHAKDVKVAHKKQDGEIEIINADRFANNIVGFFVKSFSPYSLIYVNEYKVIINETKNGDAATYPQGEVIEGDKVEIKITPDAHYHIKRVLDNGNEVPLEDLIDNSYLLEEIHEDHVIDIEFEEDIYIIKAIADEHSKIDVDETVKAFSDTTAVITVDEGYFIKDVLVDGVRVGAVKEYKFINVTANHEIRVITEKNRDVPAGSTDSNAPIFVLMMIMGLAAAFGLTKGLIKARR